MAMLPPAAGGIIQALSRLLAAGRSAAPMAGRGTAGLGAVGFANSLRGGLGDALPGGAGGPVNVGPTGAPSPANLGPVKAEELAAWAAQGIPERMVAQVLQLRGAEPGTTPQQLLLMYRQMVASGPKPVVPGAAPGAAPPAPPTPPIAPGAAGQPPLDPAEMAARGAAMAPPGAVPPPGVPPPAPAAGAIPPDVDMPGTAPVGRGPSVAAQAGQVPGTTAAANADAAPFESALQYDVMNPKGAITNALRAMGLPVFGRPGAQLGAMMQPRFVSALSGPGILGGSNLQAAMTGGGQRSPQDILSALTGGVDRIKAIQAQFPGADLSSVTPESMGMSGNLEDTARALYMYRALQSPEDAGNLYAAAQAGGFPGGVVAPGMAEMMGSFFGDILGVRRSARPLENPLDQWKYLTGLIR